MLSLYILLAVTLVTPYLLALLGIFIGKIIDDKYIFNVDD